MKKLVNMILPQNQSSVALSRGDKDRIYDRFKKRVAKKSKHAYFDRGEQPVLLRLNFEGSIFNSTTEFLVEYGSFEVIRGNTDQSDEVGFSAIVKTIIVDEPFKLTVYKKQFRANLEKIKD